MSRDTASVLLGMAATVAVSAVLTVVILRAVDGAGCSTRELEVHLAGPRAAWVEPYPVTSQWLRARHGKKTENSFDVPGDVPDDWADSDGVFKNITIDGKIDRVYLGAGNANGEPWRVNLRVCDGSYSLEDR